MKNKYIFTLLLALPFFSPAQSGRLKYANKLYNTMSYYYASEAYEDVLARKTDSITIGKNLASSYDKIGNTQKAIEWYRFLERQSPLDKDEQLRLALLEREVGNYKGSEELMASYSSKYGEVDVSREIIASTSNIDALLKGTNNFELKTQNVNTASSEMGTSYYSTDRVVIASSKRRKMAVKTIDSWTGNYFYDLYSASIDNEGTIGKMKKIKSKVQSKYHDGPAVYDASSGYFYFTRNNYLNGKKGTDDNKVIRLKIYRAQLDGSKFKNLQELAINSDSYSTAHPTLSKDGKTMYFSSDRPGSLGGMDLYSVKLDQNGTVGEPLNLGSKINTTQNDIFPSYNDLENILFFSSEGHAGLGGLDVYVVKLNKSGQATKIENLGAPINSSADDLSYVSNEKQTQGYFSSNRTDGKGDDDVYGFKQLKPIKNSAVLTGNTKDLLAGTDLENAMVYLSDKNGKIVDSTTSSSDGTFELPLNKIEGDFKLLGSKDGYVKGSKDVAFDSDKMEYKEELKFMPILDYYFTGLVTDKDTKNPLEGVKISVIDAKNNQLFEELVTQEPGAFKSSILPYKYQDNIQYNFKLEKDGYLGKTVTYTDLLAMNEDLKVNGKIELKMAKVEKGKDVSEEIGINPIYFDLNKSNIRPDAAIELDKVVKFMQDNPTISLELGSHTDSRGSNASNLSLSDRRAKSSAAYIVSKGIAASRMRGKGYGESKLVVSDSEINKLASVEEQENAHQKNRRTEFIIVKMK